MDCKGFLERVANGGYAEPSYSGIDYKQPTVSFVQPSLVAIMPNSKPSALLADTEQKQDLEGLREKLAELQKLLDELDRMQNVDSPMPTDPNAPVYAAASEPTEFTQQPAPSPMPKISFWEWLYLIPFLNLLEMVDSPMPGREGGDVAA